MVNTRLMVVRLSEVVVARDCDWRAVGGLRSDFVLAASLVRQEEE